MPNGKTIELIALNRLFQWRKPTERPTVPRDRSLNGKQRVKARKARNKES